MYYKITLPNDNSYHFLAKLSYKSIFDEKAVKSLETILSSLYAEFQCDSVVVETATVDEVLEYYTELFDNSNSYRFAFELVNHRYRMVVVSHKNHKDKSGVVTSQTIYGRRIYQTKFTSFDMAFDVSYLDTLQQDLQETSRQFVQKEAELIKKLPKYRPNTTLVMSQDKFIKAVEVSKEFQKSGINPTKSNLKNTLWPHIKGKVLNQKNQYPQSVLVNSIYLALLNNKIVEISEFLNVITEDVKPFCIETMDNVKKLFNTSEIVLINFKQNEKE